MNKTYERINWVDYPNLSTPLAARILNKSDIALNEIDNRVIGLDNGKLNSTDAADDIVDVSYASATGIFTVTRRSGQTYEIDTVLEKVVTNWTYDSTTQKIVLTLPDGSKQYVDISEMITENEFVSSDTVLMNVGTNGTVTASVKPGSITGTYLEPDYLTNVTTKSQEAYQSATNAATSATNAAASATTASAAATTAQQMIEGSFTPVGAYDPTATYQRLNVVYYNDSSWLVKKTVTGVTPVEGEYYQLMVDSNGGAAVLYTQQSLTSSQRTQARVNIGSYGNMFYQNEVVPISAWVADTTYTDYPYKADITGHNSPAASNSAIVNFDVPDAISGNFAPVCLTDTGLIRIYAKEIPDHDITIPSIVILRKDS